jgi:hypothetical protein
MVIKYTNIFRCKTLQNLPILDFWFENKPSGNPASAQRPDKALQGMCNDRNKCDVFLNLQVL